MWKLCLWSLVLTGFLAVSIYLGGVIVMWNYAMPMIYKERHSYSEYKRWKRDGFEERMIVSMVWPSIILEKEIPYDYDRGIYDPYP